MLVFPSLLFDLFYRKLHDECCFGPCFRGRGLRPLAHSLKTPFTKPSDPLYLILFPHQIWLLIVFNPHRSFERAVIPRLKLMLASTMP